MSQQLKLAELWKYRNKQEWWRVLKFDDEEKRLFWWYDLFFSFRILISERREADDEDEDELATSTIIKEAYKHAYARMIAYINIINCSPSSSSVMLYMTDWLTWIAATSKAKVWNPLH